MAFESQHSTEIDPADETNMFRVTLCYSESPTPELEQQEVRAWIDQSQTRWKRQYEKVEEKPAVQGSGIWCSYSVSY